MTELFNRVLGQATEHDSMKQNNYILSRKIFHFKFGVWVFFLIT